jgi:hypothetical protein
LRDLKLISGEFFDLLLPKEKQYLLKYFETGVQLQFLYYYYTFQSINRFVEHTGHSASKRWLIILRNRYNKLVKIYDAAKENMDFETLSLINSKKFKVGKKIAMKDK